MRRLRPQKLLTSYVTGTGHDGPVIPRRYTLTHSDFTGDLYLTIGGDYNAKQISGWYTRFMRDEVLAEWAMESGQPALCVKCHVSGGIVFGWASLRNAIFRRELPLALQAIRFGDRLMFDAHPSLDSAPIMIRFHARQSRYSVEERWGTPSDYR